MEILLVLGLLYLAYNSGALSSFGVTPPQSPFGIGSAANAPQGLQSGVSMTTPNIPAQGSSQVTSANTVGLAVTGAASVGTAAASAPASFAALGLTGAAAGAALAGIGVIVAISAALWMAHEQRKKQATDENSAMNLGVLDYDAAIRAINAAYNSRQIDAASALKALSAVMPMYWDIVAPHLQPGRNGCQNGASCPPVTSGNPCTGSIGAACCVGCYDLVGSAEPHAFTAAEGGNGSPLPFGVQGSISVVQQGGGVVLYQHVFGSKYGGKDRPAYMLTWVQSAAH